MKKRIKKKNIFEAITFNHKDKANENIIKMIIKAKSGESKNYAKVHLSNPNDLSLWVQIYSLQELLLTHPKEKLQAKLKEFKCKNRSINHFFHQKAISFEEKHICRTYVNWGLDNSIDSFFSIAMGIIEKESIKRETAKVIFDSINTAQKTHIPVFLLAQLAKKTGSETKGETLLYQAMGIIYEIQRKIGGALIVVDALKQEKIIKLYKLFDFQEIEDNQEGKTIKMMHYIYSTAL